MDERNLTTYARGMAGALRTLGPTSYDDVVGMLRRLDLSEEEAHAVIVFGIGHRILAERGGAIKKGDG